MARSTFTIPYQCSFEEAQKKVESILQGNGYHPQVNKTGENVWKNGVGMLTAMKFVKVEYGPGQIQLSAWVQVGIGSVGGGEMDLNGVVGAIPKKQLLKLIEKIKQAF